MTMSRYPTLWMQKKSSETNLKERKTLNST